MGGLRPRLHLLAIATLALQVSVPVFASAALCCKDPAALAGQTDDLMECCKKGGAHICPMKKPAKTGTTKAPDHSMRSCCTPDSRIFVALLGTAAVLTPHAGRPAAADADRSLDPSRERHADLDRGRHLSATQSLTP